MDKVLNVLKTFVKYSAYFVALVTIAKIAITTFEALIETDTKTPKK